MHVCMLNALQMNIPKGMVTTPYQIYRLSISSNNLYSLLIKYALYFSKNVKCLEYCDYKKSLCVSIFSIHSGVIGNK